MNADLVAAKLAALQDRVQRVRAHARPTSTALAEDRDALDLVSFNLLLAVQTCIDIASHLIADEGWPAATEARGAFERLEAQGVISAPTRRALSAAVGLRNVVAHGYGAVDAAQIHAASVAGLDDLDRFAREIATWVRARPE